MTLCNAFCKDYVDACGAALALPADYCATYSPQVSSSVGAGCAQLAIALLASLSIQAQAQTLNVVQKITHVIGLPLAPLTVYHTVHAIALSVSAAGVLLLPFRASRACSGYRSRQHVHTTGILS
jgi:hypothetical protein